MEKIELKSVLTKLNINYVDWLKTDSQGTDLRLFASLNNEIQNNALVLEFESGFMDPTHHNHHDVAFVYAENALAKSGDHLFTDLQKYSENKLKNKLFTFSGIGRY